MKIIMTPTLTCVSCGKKFEPRKKAQKCCSEECRYKDKIKNNARRREMIKHNKKQLVKLCAICGIEFITSTSTQIYCSCECKRNISNRRTSDFLKLGKRKCKNCGEEFQPKRSLMNYCSKQCHDNSKQNQYSEIKEKIGGKAFVETKCPICERIYNRTYFSGWIGRGMPRVNCYECEQYLISKPSAQDFYSVRI